MPKPGDRVIIEGTKVGASRREGTFVASIGSLVRIRWADGQESLLTPAPGAMQVLPARAKSAARQAPVQSRARGKIAPKPAASKKGSAAGRRRSR